MLASLMLIGLTTCGPSPESQVADRMRGTWQVVETGTEPIGRWIALDPADLRIRFLNTSTVIESPIDRDPDENVGKYRLESRDDAALGRSVMMLELEGEELALLPGAPYEVSVVGDTMVLTSAIDDGYDFKLLRALSH